MEIEQYEHGVPSWVDLGSPDIAASKAFYSGLFGWDIPEGPPETGGYSLAELRGKPVAGIGPKMNPDAPTAWLSYVNVDDADDVAAKVSSAGGQVLMGPMDVLDVGRMGLFADPAGAVFGVWQPKAHKGALLVNEPSTFAWSELVTTDVSGAKAFYGAVFGWGAEDQGEATPEGAPYTEWKVGDRSVGGMMPKPTDMPAEVPPYWGVYFAVSDTDEAVAKVAELGGTVMMGPMDIEPGRFAVVVDPSGAVFQVLALKSELQS